MIIVHILVDPATKSSNNIIYVFWEESNISPEDLVNGILGIVLLVTRKLIFKKQSFYFTMKTQKDIQ